MSFSHNSGFIESMNEEEGIELEHYLYESIYDYFKEEMVRYSKPLFYDEMMFCITEPIFDLYYDAELCVDEDYDEIYEFVKQRVDVVIESILHILPRSYSTSFLFVFCILFLLTMRVDT